MRRTSSRSLVYLDILCTLMWFVMTLNYLLTGRETSLILGFMFWILSEIYRLRKEVRNG